MKINSAKLVGITQPLIDNIKTASEFIAYTARVSNPQNQLNTNTSEKLLQYCIKNKHWSVFEMVNIVFEVTTPRDISRQVLRHNSVRFQEFSQRYADPTQELNFILREARLQDPKNRQNSIDVYDSKLQTEWDTVQTSVITEAKKAYNWAIEHGIAKEQARVVLPEGLTLSRLYMNGTLRSWIHYCEVRMDTGTQKEHKELATLIWDEVGKYFNFLVKTN